MPNSDSAQLISNPSGRCVGEEAETGTEVGVVSSGRVVGRWPGTEGELPR